MGLVGPFRFVSTACPQGLPLPRRGKKKRSLHLELLLLLLLPENRSHERLRVHDASRARDAL